MVGSKNYITHKIQSMQNNTLDRKLSSAISFLDEALAQFYARDRHLDESEVGWIRILEQKVQQLKNLPRQPQKGEEKRRW